MSDNPTKPKRIQRKRTKGWTMPPNTVSVTRPGKFGNPFLVGLNNWSPACCVRQFRLLMRRERMRELVAAARRELRGKDLACWCHLCERHKDGKPMGEVCSDCSPCHVDPLLEIANAKDSL